MKNCMSLMWTITMVTIFGETYSTHILVHTHMYTIIIHTFIIIITHKDIHTYIMHVCLYQYKVDACFFFTCSALFGGRLHRWAIGKENYIDSSNLEPCSFLICQACLCFRSYLHDNPYACSCSLVWFKRYLQKWQARIPNANSVQCNLPHSVAGQAVLNTTTTVFHCCELTTVVIVSGCEGSAHILWIVGHLFMFR